MPIENFETHFYNLANPSYEKILKSKFIQGILEGNLALEKFCFYLSQDSFYLAKEAKFFFYLSDQAKKLEEKAFFKALGKDCIAIEQEMQNSFFKEFAAKPSTKLRGVFAKYIEFLQEQAKTTYLQAIFAFFPCYLLYDKLGKELLSKYKSPNPYLSYIKTYSGEPYAEFVKTYLLIVKSHYLESDFPLQKKMEEVFLEACAWELAIFDFVA